ncbi:MAG: lysophospholipase [Clostridiales bacterium]|nr:lysophospholipase [Candidatus Blautia equi]
MTEQEIILQFVKDRSQAEKADKVERFRHLNPYVKKGQIVFAGSSLMEQFPIYEFLQDFDLPYTIYNRGVGGFTTTEMTEVLKETIYDLEPKYLFLNIGTNDLNGPDYVKEELMARYDHILNEVEAHVPDVKIFLLAYYPINPEAADNPWMKEVCRYRTNTRINEASEGVKALAEKHGASFLNLNAGITDEKGNLKAEYTIEGMHMYANGYKPVLDALLPVLETLK